jgi:hypothetical protein
MTVRLDTLKARLAQYIECETTILGGAQEYSIGSRRLTRANLKEIADMIQYLEREVANEESKTAGKGRNRVFGVIPRDF